MTNHREKNCQNWLKTIGKIEKQNKQTKQEEKQRKQIEWMIILKTFPQRENLDPDFFNDKFCQLFKE